MKFNLEQVLDSQITFVKKSINIIEIEGKTATYNQIATEVKKFHLMDY